ncbi:MAG: YlmH/Sll1252 family protein [Oscillospiraceae bacterium]
MREYIPPVNDEERLFAKKIAKLALDAKYSGTKHATMFLSDRQQDIASAVLKHNQCEDYIFAGGFDTAQRKILCFCMNSECAKASISCAEVKANNSKSILTHRDYLGAFLSLGIRREAMGDILADANRAVVFALPAVITLLCNELSTVGRETVSITPTSAPDTVVQLSEKEPVTASVASMRIDVILAAMLKASRSEAQGLVRSALVEVNHIQINSVHYDICEDDVITVRGYGKYKLTEIGGKSRKDRTFVQFIQF